MTLAPPDPRVGFQTRWAYAALKAAIKRGEGTIISRGGRGTAKTMSHVYLFHRMCLEYPGMRQTWMRWERSKMTETVLPTFEDEILGIGHPMRSGQSRENRRGYEYPNGSRIMLMGISDDPDATKSLQSDLIWVNECGQVPFNIWDEIGGAARARVGLSPFGLKRLKIGDLNSMPPSHWTNQLAALFPPKLFPHITDDGRDFGKVFTQEMYQAAQRYNLEPLDRSKHKHKLIQWFPPDNPGYWDFYAWDWTAPGLEYVLNRLGVMGRVLKARYLEGRPVAVEGVVFPEFDRGKHVCVPYPTGWPASWPVTISYDPGYSHPCAVVFWGVTPDDEHHIVDEIHGSGIDIDTLAEKVKAKARQYRVVSWLADPRGANQKTQIAKGETVIGYMQRVHQLFFHPWKAAKGKEIQDQVEAVRSLLLASQPLQIWDRCTGVISEFESWRNKVDAQGELAAGDDAYENRNNDAMDAIRGIVADKPRYEQASFSISRSE